MLLPKAAIAGTWPLSGQDRALARGWTLAMALVRPNA